jgi:CheY-like chemotaxis protein
MRKILIVEDEEVLREGYDTILSTEPYIIDTASNGKAALKKFKEKRYDLILLDLMMPVMDGLAFLRKLTKLEDDLPKILLLTNLAFGKDIDEALSLGVHGVIIKANLSPKQLLAKIRYEVEAS